MSMLVEQTGGLLDAGGGKALIPVLAKDGAAKVKVGGVVVEQKEADGRADSGGGVAPWSSLTSVESGGGSPLRAALSYNLPCRTFVLLLSGL